MSCACCGQTPSRSVALSCHPEIVLCDNCVDWLQRQLDQQTHGRPVATIVNTDPTFRVADVALAAAHYRRLGFSIEHHDPSYAFALRDDLTIHITDRPEGVTGGTVVYLHVDDADQLVAEWRAAGFDVADPVDTDYGKHEGSHVDPDGNVLRFGSPI